jgi:glycosyltransferase involved in cell wall biosynthesis
MANSKLSILIPTYDWDISQLMLALSNEINDAKMRDVTEIIIVDDCSTIMDIKEVNAKSINNLAGVSIKYHELKKNIGRSRIRNLLAKEASGSHLLFLDSDILPDQKDFIRRYIDHFSWEIVCGGISYNQRILLEPIYDFHVYFGKKTEVKSHIERNLIPWRYLFSSNLMIRKDLFDKVSFDDSINCHGYEDIEWAIRLSKASVIYHINNTVSHLGLKTKKHLFNQMRNATNNYIYLSKLHQNDFAETPIYLFINYLSKLSLTLLKMIDSTLISIFIKSNNNELLYNVYQFNKAIIFAIKSKQL